MTHVPKDGSWSTFILIFRRSHNKFAPSSLQVLKRLLKTQSALTMTKHVTVYKKLFFPLQRIGHLLQVLCLSKSFQKSSWLVAKWLDGSQQILRQVEDPKFEQHLLSVGPRIPPPRLASLCDNSKNRGMNITWWIGPSWDFDPSKSWQLFSLSL